MKKEQKMVRFTLSVVLILSAATANAQSNSTDAEKAESCRYQAAVVRAVQQARLDDVAERRVEKTITDSDPDWPAKYNVVIPLVTPWVYEQPIQQVRENDLGDAWNEMCVQQ
jgi:hypothetical protein